MISINPHGSETSIKSYLDNWCHGSLHNQVISCHGIDYVGKTSFVLLGNYFNYLCASQCREIMENADMFLCFLVQLDKDILP